jgi:hypothetical protein
MKKHGMSESEEYSIWSGIKKRCECRTAKDYPNYGGRGIKVCERWQTFENFFEDMGKRPSKKHSVEREDNQKDYSPENCKWATVIEQANNRRSNNVLTMNGISRTLVEWERVSGIGRSTIKNRLNLGWTVEMALTLPVRPIASGRCKNV